MTTPFSFVTITSFLLLFLEHFIAITLLIHKGLLVSLLSLFYSLLTSLLTVVLDPQPNFSSSVLRLREGLPAVKDRYDFVALIPLLIFATSLSIPSLPPILSLSLLSPISSLLTV